VSPATLPLIEAAVAAVEAELRIRRLDDAAAPTRRSSPKRRSIPGETVLNILGTEDGKLESALGTLELSQRHSEIVALLAWNRDGLSAERLAEAIYGRNDAVDTLRAEMVRLRRVLGEFDATLVPRSRPYRLGRPVELDAHRVLTFLDKGAHRVALAAYTGRMLPTSQAPGILAIGAEVSGRLRDALLTDASVDTLLTYARTDEAAYDIEVWRAALRMLPPKSPKRAGVVSRIESLERELARN
jgi:hypothetical protein